MLPLFHRTADQALVVAALPTYADLGRRKRLHKYVLHVRSSQAFALNLFAPLDHDGIVATMRALGLAAVDAFEPEFEYEEPTRALAEARPSSPHQTQVDVVLRGHDGQGRTLVALIEVKLTETDFSGCSAYDNPDNPTRSNCYTPGLFGSEPSACFQLNNHGQGHRRYDTFLADIPVHLPEPPRSDGGCLVRTGLNQPMRNLALAHFLLQDQQAHQVAYALAAPAGYDAIWRRFNELQNAFPDIASRSIVALQAETVADLHPDHGDDLRRRYPEPIIATATTS
jgi:hypothetical protein